MMKLMMKGVSYNQLVSNLSCTISTGITYIVGKNGSGKSTFLKLCATAIEPSEGSMEYIQMVPGAGTQKVMTIEDVRKSIGYLPQEFTGFPELSIERYIRYMATHKGIPTSHVKEVVQIWLKKTNLYSIRKKRLRTLSGGQLKKVGLIQAFINQPKICLLDEPFEHLELTERRFFENEIQKLSFTSMVLLSTHLIDQPNDGKILLLEKGKIQLFAPYTEDLYDQVFERLEK